MTGSARVARGLATLLCLALGACSNLGVEVWERDSLSRPEMQFLDADPGLIMEEHFYFSKEGTSGGRGFAGGGCGCN